MSEISDENLREVFGGEQHADQPERVKFEYVRSLDGVRAVAVLIVFCYHAALVFPFFKNHLQGGFLGVDVFFVLSGFLITSVLLQEFDHTNDINFKNFYLRRFLRLMPAYWLFLAIMFFFTDALFPREIAAQTYAHNNFLYALFYLTNWQRALNGSEIAGLLGHTWSLAVEEQFYLIWAGLLFLMLRRLTRNSVVIATAALILAAAVFRAARWHGTESVDYLYNAFDSRIDALLIGCLCGQLISWGKISKSFLSSREFTLCAVISLLIVVVIFFNLSASYNSPFLYLGGFTVFASAVGVCVAWLAANAKKSSKNYLQKFLETKPLVWIGKTSYGIYLWHSTAISFCFPLFAKPLVRLLAASVLTFALAVLSYYLVEVRFLKLKKRFR